jgi:hypothetical protein
VKRPPKVPPTGARGIRYLAPAQDVAARIEEEAPTPSHWGARFVGNTPELGTLASVLTLPSRGLPPRPIGVQFWRQYPPGNGEHDPADNADVRAVVTFAAGESRSLVFRCDWQGALLLHAQSVSIEIESFNPTPGETAFQAIPLDLGVALALSAPRPLQAPTLTVLPDGVGNAMYREIECPAFATRIGLLLTYGVPVGSSADAPLGQIFLTFCTWNGVAIAWIDAQNARASLFGDGVPLPAGTHHVVLSNRSGYDVTLGAVFHLGGL